MLTRSAIIISLILSIILVVQFIISQEQKEKIIILQKSIEKLSEERDILNDDNERLSGKLKKEKFLTPVKKISIKLRSKKHNAKAIPPDIDIFSAIGPFLISKAMIIGKPITKVGVRNIIKNSNPAKIY